MTAPRDSRHFHLTVATERLVHRHWLQDFVHNNIFLL